MLFQLLELRGAFGVVDPCRRHGAIARACAARGFVAFSNTSDSTEEADFHEDATQPGTYEEFTKGGACLDVVISNPWYALLDVLLPLAVRHARTMTCMRVPGNYLSAAPKPRLDWLTWCQSVYHVVWLRGLECERTGQPSLWLMIFPNQDAMHRVLKVELLSAELLDPSTLWVRAGHACGPASGGAATITEESGRTVS